MKLEKGPNILRVMLGATEDGSMDAAPGAAGGARVVELETKLRVCLRDTNTCEQPVAPLPPYSCELARRLAVLTEGFRDVHGHLATLIQRCELPQTAEPVCCTSPRK